MCTVVVLFRPRHAWPVVVAANRDEMHDRPWDPPARHWPDRRHVTGGLDRLAGGTWMAINDDGLIACVLNRMHTLGPVAGKRSRGELPLEALDHAEADIAAEALAALDPHAYRPFNLLVADCRSVWWLRNDGSRLAVVPVAPGLAMITAHDLNDTAASPRMRRHLPRFRAAPAPVPDADGGRGDWFAWETLMAGGTGADSASMCVDLPDGFRTVSSSLCALPAPAADHRSAVWRFASGPPGRTGYRPVMLS